MLGDLLGHRQDRHRPIQSRECHAVRNGDRNRAAFAPFAVAERGGTALGSSPLAAWGGLLYLAVFETVLAFVFFYEGVKGIGAARATSFAFLIPVFGVVSSVIMLGEHLAVLTALGGVLVLLGLWLVQEQPGAPAAKRRAVQEHA